MITFDHNLSGLFAEIVPDEDVRIRNAEELGSNKEGRALSSVVARTVHRGTDSCLLCRTNTDPKAVPLHPNCTCNIATEDVQIGQIPNDDPQFRVMSTADEEIVFLSESDLPVAITLDPATTGVIDVDELRFGDMARWLEEVQPLLDGSDLLLSIMDVSDDNVRRVWFSVARMV